jgi:ABC-type uncharacterized transport system substrate-binding protein
VTAAWRDRARSRPRVAAALLLCAGAALELHPAPATAHPHAWIDLRTTILFDASGAVAGLREDWLFDDFTSVTVLEDLGKGSDVRDQQTLLAVARQILKNVGDYGYFTRIEVDDAVETLTLDQDVAAEMRADRLAIAFTVRTPAPADPRQHRVAYSVYDPTYFTEVLHAEGADPIALSETAPNGCATTLQTPTPSPTDVAAAAAIDVNGSGGDQLGKLFAEKVLLKCP